MVACRLQGYRLDRFGPVFLDISTVNRWAVSCLHWSAVRSMWSGRLGSPDAFNALKFSRSSCKCKVSLLEPACLKLLRLDSVIWCCFSHYDLITSGSSICSMVIIMKRVMELSRGAAVTWSRYSISDPWFLFWFVQGSPSLTVKWSDGWQ